ncbi:MAG: hypothetical protein CMH62_03895 [Nanoarchaeota archaeon]|nr:hypothetical protein [Nanoarchaeota archaeon]
MEKIYKKLKPLKVSHLDGVTFEFKDYWFNLRPSNTEPLLRVNLEANDRKTMNKKKRELLKRIK